MDIRGAGPQTRSGFDGGLSQGEPAGRSVASVEIESIVHPRQMAVGEEKLRVTGNGLIEDAGNLKQSLRAGHLCVPTVPERFRPQVEIVGGEISGRRLLDGGFLHWRKL